MRASKRYTYTYDMTSLRVTKGIATARACELTLQFAARDIAMDVLRQEAEVKRPVRRRPGISESPSLSRPSARSSITRSRSARTRVGRIRPAVAPAVQRTVSPSATAPLRLPASPPSPSPQAPSPVPPPLVQPVFVRSREAGPAVTGTEAPAARAEVAGAPAAGVRGSRLGGAFPPPPVVLLPVLALRSRRGDDDERP